MIEMQEFKPFKVSCPENRRYWEDEGSDILVKRGAIVQINSRHFRSRELRFALLRSQLLLVEGECWFAFREEIVHIRPGKNNKNYVISITKDGKSTEVVFGDGSIPQPKPQVPEELPPMEDIEPKPEAPVKVEDPKQTVKVYPNLEDREPKQVRQKAKDLKA